MLTDEEIEQLIRGVYSGAINTENLPINLYASYVDAFSKSINEAFKGANGIKENELRAELFENVQLFSGAKTFQEIKDFESLLTDKGRTLTLDEFKIKALERYKLYNKTWLDTEILFTTESARAGRQWIDIWEDRKIFPMLEYVTVGDGLVRDTHKVLDGIIRPVEDAFWDSYYPPWSWRCRCIVKKLETGTPTTIVNRLVQLPKIKKFFANNVGKTGKIFNGFHPYFKEVPDRYKEWAKQNFGLPFIKLTKEKKSNWQRPSNKLLK